MPLFHQNTRAELRRQYAEAWRNRHAGKPLQPLEREITAVIAQHPEYHALIEADEALEAEFPPEMGVSNPYLHMGLHLGLREQVSTDRPRGIAGIHRNLSQRLNSAHEAEHRMLEVLAEAIWEAQRAGVAPDEARYLERLQRLQTVV